MVAAHADPRPWGAFWAGAGLRLTAVIAIAIAALGLFAALLYCLVFTEPTRPLWLALDVALLVAAGYALHRWRDAFPLACLGQARLRRLLEIAVVATAVPLFSHWAIPHGADVGLDEGQYLELAQRGELIRQGLAPFALRWLVPFLAGRWSVLPVDEAGAIAALSFSGLVVAGALLGLLLARLGVRWSLCLTAPLALHGSYLGEYAAFNRALIDPFNYAMFAVLAHALLRREHRGWLAGLLLLSALNSEKAVIWIPAIFLAELASEPRARGRLWRALRSALVMSAPTVLYLAAITWYLAPARSEVTTCFELISKLGFTDLHIPAVSDCSWPPFRTLWFPFGAFTIFAALGLAASPPRLRPLVLVLAAVLAQTLIATDTERMLAYSFIVVLPLGYVYLHDVLAALPRWLGVLLFAVVLLVLTSDHLLFPAIRRVNELLDTWRIPLRPRSFKLRLAVVEFLAVGTLLYLGASMRLKRRA